MKWAYRGRPLQPAQAHHGGARLARVAQEAPGRLSLPRRVEGLPNVITPRTHVQGWVGPVIKQRGIYPPSIPTPKTPVCTDTDVYSRVCTDTRVKTRQHCVHALVHTLGQAYICLSIHSFVFVVFVFVFVFVCVVASACGFIVAFVATAFLVCVFVRALSFSLSLRLLFFPLDLRLCGYKRARPASCSPCCSSVPSTRCIYL